MKDKEIICPFLPDQDGGVLLSPLVGELKVFVNFLQIITPNQIIAQITSLGIVSPISANITEPMQIIKLINHAPVAFKQEILWLKRFNQVNVSVSEQKEIKKSNLAILSPMDGMFYNSTKPQNPPLIEEGDTILPNQTVGIIEVMKCFFPIKYTGETKAKVISVLLKNQTPVQHGQQLFLLDS